jgi:hypothetical protein
LDHAECIHSVHPPLGETAGGASGSAEEGSGLVGSDVGSGDVFVEVFLKHVMGRHVVLLAALFVQSHPEAPSRLLADDWSKWQALV